MKISLYDRPPVLDTEGAFDDSDLLQRFEEKAMEFNRPGGFVDALRKGTAGFLRSFVPSNNIETDRLTALIGNEQERLNDPIGKHMTQAQWDAHMRENAQSAANPNFLGLRSLADYIEPTPHAEPDNLLGKAAYKAGEYIPGIAGSVAEFMTLGPLGTILLNTGLGGQAAQQQVYENQLAQGKSTQEARDIAEGFLGNAADFAVRGGTNLATLWALGRAYPGFQSGISPVGHTLRNIGLASGISGAGAMGEEALTNYRSDKDNNLGNLAETGATSAATTGIIGLTLAGLRAKKLIEAQREYNAYQGLHNVEWRDITPPDAPDEPLGLGGSNNPQPPNNPPQSPNGTLALPQGTLQLPEFTTRNIAARLNKAVTQRGFNPITNDFQPNALARQIAAYVGNGYMSMDDALSMLQEGGLSPEQAKGFLDTGIAEILERTRVPETPQQPQTFELNANDWQDPLFPTKTNITPPAIHQSNPYPTPADFLADMKAKKRQAQSQIRRMEKDFPLQTTDITEQDKEKEYTSAERKIDKSQARVQDANEQFSSIKQPSEKKSIFQNLRVLLERNDMYQGGNLSGKKKQQPTPEQRTQTPTLIALGTNEAFYDDDYYSDNYPTKNNGLISPQDQDIPETHLPDTQQETQRLTALSFKPNIDKPNVSHFKPDMQDVTASRFSPNVDKPAISLVSPELQKPNVVRGLDGLEDILQPPQRLTALGGQPQETQQKPNPDITFDEALRKVAEIIYQQHSQKPYEAYSVKPVWDFSNDLPEPVKTQVGEYIFNNRIMVNNRSTVDGYPEYFIGDLQALKDILKTNSPTGKQSDEQNTTPQAPTLTALNETQQPKPESGGIAEDLKNIVKNNPTQKTKTKLQPVGKPFIDTEDELGRVKQVTNPEAVKIRDSNLQLLNDAENDEERIRLLNTLTHQQLKDMHDSGAFGVNYYQGQTKKDYIDSIIERRNRRIDELRREEEIKKKREQATAIDDSDYPFNLEDSYQGMPKQELQAAADKNNSLISSIKDETTLRKRLSGLHVPMLRAMSGYTGSGYKKQDFINEIVRVATRPIPDNATLKAGEFSVPGVNGVWTVKPNKAGNSFTIDNEDISHSSMVYDPKGNYFLSLGQLDSNTTGAVQDYFRQHIKDFYEAGENTEHEDITPQPEPVKKAKPALSPIHNYTSDEARSAAENNLQMLRNADEKERIRLLGTLDKGQLMNFAQAMKHHGLGDIGGVANGITRIKQNFLRFLNKPVQDSKPVTPQAETTETQTLEKRPTTLTPPGNWFATLINDEIVKPDRAKSVQLSKENLDILRNATDNDERRKLLNTLTREQLMQMRDFLAFYPPHIKLPGDGERKSDLINRFIQLIENEKNPDSAQPQTPVPTPVSDNISSVRVVSFNDKHETEKQPEQQTQKSPEPDTQSSGKRIIPEGATYTREQKHLTVKGLNWRGHDYGDVNFSVNWNFDYQGEGGKKREYIYIQSTQKTYIPEKGGISIPRFFYMIDNDSFWPGNNNYGSIDDNAVHAVEKAFREHLHEFYELPLQDDEKSEITNLSIQGTLAALSHTINDFEKKQVLKGTPREVLLGVWKAIAHDEEAVFDGKTNDLINNIIKRLNSEKSQQSHENTRNDVKDENLIDFFNLIEENADMTTQERDELHYYRYLYNNITSSNKEHTFRDLPEKAKIIMNGFEAKYGNLGTEKGLMWLHTNDLNSVEVHDPHKAAALFAEMSRNHWQDKYDIALAVSKSSDSPVFSLAKKVFDYIDAQLGNQRFGNGLMKPFSNDDLRKWAEQEFGGSIGEGAYTQKQAYDAMEMGINMAIRKHRYIPNDDYPHTFIRIMHVLNDILSVIPTQSNRTPEQVEAQQFSTPPTLAYLVNWLAHINNKNTVLEPSAGTGNLAVFAKNAGANLILNDFSESGLRADILDALGWGKVYREDAMQLGNILAGEVRDGERSENDMPDRVVMNPPFSSAWNLRGNNKNQRGNNKNQNGFKHVMSALKALRHGGRLVAILGAGRDGSASSVRKWLNGEYEDVASPKGKYNVRALITVDGKAYKKYGTTFSNAVVVIDKTGATPKGGTAEFAFSGDFSNDEEVRKLFEAMQAIRNDIHDGDNSQPNNDSNPPKPEPPKTTPEPAQKNDTYSSNGKRIIPEGAILKEGSFTAKGKYSKETQYKVKPKKRDYIHRIADVLEIHNVGASFVYNPEYDLFSHDSDFPEAYEELTHDVEKAFRKHLHEFYDLPQNKSDIPDTIKNNAALRNIYDYLDGNTDLTLKVDEAIRASMESNFRYNLQKERQIQEAISLTLGNAGFEMSDNTRMTRHIYELVRNNQGYDDEHHIIATEKPKKEWEGSTHDRLKQEEATAKTAELVEKVKAAKNEQEIKAILDSVNLHYITGILEGIVGRLYRQASGITSSMNRQQVVERALNTIMDTLHGKPSSEFVLNHLEEFSFFSLKEYAKDLGIDIDATLATRDDSEENIAKLRAAINNAIKADSIYATQENQPQMVQKQPEKSSNDKSQSGHIAKIDVQPEFEDSPEPQPISIYSDYEPQEHKGIHLFNFAKPHTSKLVETTNMKNVKLPPLKYEPDLPVDIISSGNITVSQLEAIAYAGQAFSKKLPSGQTQGFILGDGTGAGKGRTIAGIIRDQLNHNHGNGKAVWFSVKTDLVGDARRDWQGISNNPKDIFELKAFGVNDSIPESKKGILFSSYSTFITTRTVSKKNEPATDTQTAKSVTEETVDESRIQQVVEWLGKDFDGVIAFDECHKINNLGESKKGSRKINHSQSAIVASKLAQALPNARVLYVSATAATDPSQLLMFDRAGLWGKDTPF